MIAKGGMSMANYSAEADVRITVKLSSTLLAKLDEHIPTRQRSHFIQGAIEELLAIEEQTQALAETAGAWAGEPYADLDSPEAVEGWIREFRSSWHTESGIANEPVAA
jgi:Arc/MetJ-type ribon-helix-helix transcriptional regulator